MPLVPLAAVALERDSGPQGHAAPITAGGDWASLFQKEECFFVHIRLWLLCLRGWSYKLNYDPLQGIFGWRLTDLRCFQQTLYAFQNAFELFRGVAVTAKWYICLSLQESTDMSVVGHRVPHSSALKIRSKHFVLLITYTEELANIGNFDTIHVHVKLFSGH